MPSSEWRTTLSRLVLAAGLGIAALSAGGTVILLWARPGVPGARLAFLLMSTYWLGGWLILDAAAVACAYVVVRKTGRFEPLGASVPRGLIAWSAVLILEFVRIKVAGNRMDVWLVPAYGLAAIAVLVGAWRWRELVAYAPFAAWLFLEAAAHLLGDHPKAFPLWAWGPLSAGGLLYVRQVIKLSRYGSRPGSHGGQGLPS